MVAAVAQQGRTNAIFFVHSGACTSTTVLFLHLRRRLPLLANN
jgi:hypothetical protein